jgi:hypothetical protein
MRQRHEKVRHENRRPNVSRFASRYSIAVIVLRAIRVRAVISFEGHRFAASSQCFRAFLLPLGAPPAGSAHPAHLAPLTAGARRCRPLRFDLVPPFPQLSNAWFFDRGVIWSEGPDQPAELGSPTAIGNFRDTDRSASFNAGLAA